MEDGKQLYTEELISSNSAIPPETRVDCLMCMVEISRPSPQPLETAVISLRGPLSLPVLELCTALDAVKPTLWNRRACRESIIAGGRRPLWGS